MFNILFVCMGNICRSPSAEGFFRKHLLVSPLRDLVRVDSAGTHSYHIGDPPDSRAISEAARYGVDLGSLRARQIRHEDLHTHDLILAMDRGNLSILQRMAGNSDKPRHLARLRLMMEYSPQYSSLPEVPDPYFGGRGDFAYMCELLDEATQNLLEVLTAELAVEESR